MSCCQSVHSVALASWSSSSAADVCEETWPNYNIDAVEFLLEKVGALGRHSEPFTLVEVGAGTGKFTRAALKVIEKRSVQNVNVVPTEPIKEMCKKFKEMVPNIEIHQRTADDLGLPSNSVDAIVAAQCFHWFASTESVREIHRVLKPGGIFGVIWNVPDKSVSWIREVHEMLSPKYAELQVLRSSNEEVLLHVTNHGGFGEDNREDSYRYAMESDFGRAMKQFKGYSAVSFAEKSEKDALIAKFDHIMQTNPDVKNKEKFTCDYVVKINWFKKL